MDTTPADARPALLRLLAEYLATAATEAIAVEEIARAELAQLIHDAAAREHRRAAFNEYDRRSYRLGGSFRPSGGENLDDVALAGFLGLGVHGVMLLATIALRPEHQGKSVSGLLERLFRSEAGPGIRAWGVHARFVHLQALYRQETDTFLASRKGRDPRQRWRREKVTVNQAYLIAEICILLEIGKPELGDRGEAFEWIHARGGNPRFRERPAAVAIPQLARTA